MRAWVVVAVLTLGAGGCTDEDGTTHAEKQRQLSNLRRDLRDARAMEAGEQQSIWSKRRAQRHENIEAIEVRIADLEAELAHGRGTFAAWAALVVSAGVLFVAGGVAWTTRREHP